MFKETYMYIKAGTGCDIHMGLVNQLLNITPLVLQGGRMDGFNLRILSTQRVPKKV